MLLTWSCVGLAVSSAQSQPPLLGSAIGPRPKVALVLGSEGQGLSQESLQRAQHVTIPMAGSADSLNVSQAGAILMFMLSDGMWPLAGRLYGNAGLSDLTGVI